VVAVTRPRRAPMRAIAGIQFSTVTKICRMAFQRTDDFISVSTGFLGHGIAVDAICHANIAGLSTSTNTLSTPRRHQIGHRCCLSRYPAKVLLLNQAEPSAFE
jgi:hypothetical protein